MAVIVKRHHAAACVLGVLLGAALADKPPNIPEDIRQCSFTNCTSPLPGCNVYDHWLSTIDPFCCSETVSDCTDYRVEMWQCAAGGTRYRNFQADGEPLGGESCVGSDPACY